MNACCERTAEREALQHEHRRLHRLQNLADRTAAEIQYGQLTLGEAIRLVETTREMAIAIIPHQMDTYDLIYGARFTRLIWQFVVCDS